MNPSLQLAFFLGLKNTLSNKRIMLLTIGIIAISLVNSLFFSGILGGMSQSMIEGFIQNTYSNIIIEPYEGTEYFKNAKSIMKKIESIDGIQGVARRIALGANIIKGDRSGSPLVVFGIEPEREMEINRIHTKIPDGEFLEPLDSAQIVIGAYIANEKYQEFFPEEDTLGVESGDVVTATYNNGIKKEYRVKGILFTKALLADQMAFINIEEAENIVGKKDVASMIIVKVPTGQEDHYINKLRVSGINGEIYHWREKATFVKSITKSFDLINVLVTSFSLATVAITIFIIIYIQTTSRKRQIGILKAMGITQNVILMSYLMQAVVYGVLGVIVGNVIFQIMTLGFTNHPLDLPLGFVVPHVDIIVLISANILVILFSILGGIVPAYIASKSNIIESIWG